LNDGVQGKHDVQIMSFQEMMEADDVAMVIWPGVMPGDQIPHTTIATYWGWLTTPMIRNKLSQLLAVASVKVAQDKTPERVKAQLQVSKKALIQEVNCYRSALSKFISPK
jgi:hypothetical protein